MGLQLYSLYLQANKTGCLLLDKAGPLERKQLKEKSTGGVSFLPIFVHSTSLTELSMFAFLTFSSYLKGRSDF